MKLVKLLVAWAIVAFVTLAFGWWLYSYKSVSSNIGPLFRISSIAFAAATATLGFTFKLLETAPPKELDERRSDKWRATFSRRWQMLWVRWGILLAATVTSGLSAAVLENQLTWGAPRLAGAAGLSAIVVGLLITGKSLFEIFYLRRKLESINSELQDRARRQKVLERLEGNPGH